MPGRQVPKLTTIWPDVNSALDGIFRFIERLDSWSWGEGFYVEDNEAGRIVHYTPTEQVQHARTKTGGITARSGSTLGSGTIVLLTRSGATVSDGPEGLCYSNYAAAVAHPTNITVGWDGSAWVLLGTDCP